MRFFDRLALWWIRHRGLVIVQDVSPTTLTVYDASGIRLGDVLKVER